MQAASYGSPGGDMQPHTGPASQSVGGARLSLAAALLFVASLACAAWVSGLRQATETPRSTVAAASAAAKGWAELGVRLPGGGTPWAPLPAPDTVLRRVAFGSCQRQDLPHPHWDVMWGLR